MDLARLPGLDHQAGLQAVAEANQVVMDRGYGEQRGDRRAAGPDAAVGEDHYLRAGHDRVVGLVAEVGQPGTHALRALLDRPGDVQGVGLEDVPLDVSQGLQLLVAQDRLVHPQLVGVIRRLLQEVLLGPHRGGQRHDDRLADRVDRRVGDLREELLEVGGERRRAVGENREGAVVAHRADRLGAGLGHRRDQHPEVFLRVPEGQAAQVAGQHPRHRHVGRLEVVEVDAVLAEPLGVGLLRRYLALDLLVLDDPALLEVDQEDLPGLQAAEPLHVGGVDGEHAGLRAQDDEAVVGLNPASRAQAVAVEGGAHDPTVGEADSRRSVPRLEQARVEGVEALQLVGEVVTVAVGLGDHHHRRVRQRAPAEHQQLEDVVEGGRVRTAGADDRHDLLEVVAEQLTGQLALAGPHPVDVPHEGVDLAVMGDHPERVGQLPAREGVGREPGVDQRERGGEPLVLQVGVEAADLVGDQHPLVDAGPRREARGIEVRAGGQLDYAPDHVALALEGLLVLGESGAGGDEALADLRPRSVGGTPDEVGVYGDVAPPEEDLALGGDGVLDQLLDLAPERRLAGQEADTNRVAARLGQLEVDHLPEEEVGNLNQDACPVAGLDVGALGAAVLKVVERLQRPDDHLVRGLVVEPCHHRHATGVVLKAWVVEALGLWSCRPVHRSVASRSDPCHRCEANPGFYP